MAKDIGEFVYELDNYVRLYDHRTGEIMNKITRAIVIALVHATPVKTGLARSNWQVAPGEGPDNGGIDIIRSEEEIVFDRMQRLSFVPKLTDVAIFNNVDYIFSLNAGSSEQAPAGFVEQAVLAGAAVVADRVELVEDGDFT